ncbi:MAG: phenylalanine--tRNA ligase beta subunit-related protein [Prolixibacteraceae bacterium]|jgi:DNA/RNA-binding domain of Phe-tRNA-synthetase-like protein|nr:phenylalanine--tRNA ligase beta subunit-related protein [Prolixibacteraceae bacterium]
MVQIEIENSWKERCPWLSLAGIEADVQVQNNQDILWAEIDLELEKIQHKLTFENISKIPAIASSRKAYKMCGKDPARYRLSAEALLRRVVGGKGLYRVNNVVDQLNFVSVTTGFSIGGYDVAKIQGNILFGVAGNEPYTGIGRGELNIEGLPVFRDSLGAFGTPTSDSERTAVTKDTRRFLMIIINFGNDPGLAEAQQKAAGLLEKYCSAKNIEQTVMRC